MQSSDAGPTDIPILEETIGDNFERTVAANPNGDALVDMASGRRWTYTELNDEIDVVARGLMALGIERGERVGMWAPNCPEWTIVQYATAKIGAILVNINPAYRTHELAYVLEQSGVRTLVSATAFKTSDYVAMVGEVRPDAPDLEEVVFLGTDDWTRLVDSGQAAADDALRARMATLDNNEPINIQYTSGTTGFPKGATLSHRNILNNGYFTTELINLGPEDRLCIPVPFYHCFGMVMGNLGCTSHGATMVIPAPDSTRPRRSRPSKRSAAPRSTACRRCSSRCSATRLRRPRPVVAAYRHHGRRDLPDRGDEALRRRDAHDRGAIAYGMTETSPVSCQTLIDDDLERRTATIGRVHPHVEIKIVDPDTGESSTGSARRVLHTRLLGDARLLAGRGQDAEAIDDDGWMHTGDLAVMRDDGYCNIVGRIKDMVIRGGENIYPREIEEFLYTHPDIEDAQVIGVPDDKYGEEICAWVRMKPGRAAGRSGRSRFRRRQAGPLQDPALRPRRRRVPDDHHRQGPQGRDARRNGQDSRPARQEG